jgi:hypothetical protein
MMPYRVLRILEYTYDSVETADRDMMHWQIPAEGRAPGFKDKVTIRSTVIQYPTKEEDDGN